MSSFDKLSHEAMEALSNTHSQADELLGELVTAEVVEEEAQEIHEMSADFYQHAKEQHFATSQFMKRPILVDMIVSHDYIMPELDVFDEKLKALEPIFDEMDKRNWNPKIIFAPNGLLVNQWDEMLTGHTLKNGKKSKGLIYKVDLRSARNQPLGPITDNLWDVGVITSKSSPSSLEISPNGRSGQNPSAVIGILKNIAASHGLPISNLSDEELIKWFSPSPEAYLSLQLGKLASDQDPVDGIVNATIGKPSVQGDIFTSEKTLYYCWNEHSGTLLVRDTGLEKTLVRSSLSHNTLGLRHTIMGRQLL